MHSLRHQRVRELLKRTVGDILRRELNTEKCGLVSVNDVGIANDLKSATIFVSVLGSETQKKFAPSIIIIWKSHQTGVLIVVKEQRGGGTGAPSAMGPGRPPPPPPRVMVCCPSPPCMETPWRPCVSKVFRLF